MVLQVHQCTVSVLRGGIPDYRQGRGGGSEIGSGVEGRAAVAGGCVKITMTSGRDEDDNIGAAGGDRGQGGACRGSIVVHTHEGGPADQGGLWRLGEIKRRSAPKLGG